MPIQDLIQVTQFMVKNCFKSEEIDPKSIVGISAIESSILNNNTLQKKYRLIYNTQLIQMEFSVAIFESMDYKELRKQLVSHNLRKTWFYKLTDNYYQQKSSSYYFNEFISFDSIIENDGKTFKFISIEAEEYMGEPFIKAILFSNDEYHKLRRRNRSQVLNDCDTVDTKKSMFEDLSTSNLLNTNFSRNSSMINSAANKLKTMDSKETKGSVLAFIWGGTLAAYIKKLEDIRVQSVLKNLYPEYIKSRENDQVVMRIGQFKNDEYALYYQILNRLKISFGGLFKEHSQSLISILNSIFKNEVYSYFRNIKSLRYLPVMVKSKNIKIFKKKQANFVNNKYAHVFERSFYNDDGQFQDKFYNYDSGMNFDFAFIDISADIVGKYRLRANIRYILEKDLLEQFKYYGKGYSDEDLDLLRMSFKEGFNEHCEQNKEDIMFLKYFWLVNFLVNSIETIQ